MKLILFLTLSISANAKELNVWDFIEQVKTNHTGYKGAQSAQEGTNLRIKEADLITLPQLSLTAQGGVDKREPTNPNMGTKSFGQDVGVAISERTAFGLDAKLSYDWMFRDTEHAEAAFLPHPEYYSAVPSIEISQSLWKNRFGSEVRAQQELATANAKTSNFTESYSTQAHLIDAHNTYLKLYYTRQTLKALQESLNLSAKLKQWAQNRTATNLGDRSDFLQTKTAYESRQLDLIKTQFDEKSLSRYFNSLRGVDSDVVVEDLIVSKPSPFKKESLTKTKWRDDVSAAMEGLKLAKAKSKVEQERNKPTLELFGKYSFNSWDQTSSDAISSSTDSDFPVYVAGIRFVTPLAFGKASDVRNGYEKEVFAADLKLQRKLLEQDRDYQDLQAKIENAYERLKLAQVLEASQKEKLEAERKRHLRGRTTLFQVLQYEQEFVASQLKTITTESEYYTLLNEIQFYKGQI